VSLDPTTKKPVSISPLKVETAEERRVFEEGQMNYDLKKKIAKTTLRKEPPNDEESKLIHTLWLQQLAYNGELSPSPI
jgi:acyl-coenzyme A thioesterase 9